MTTAQPRPTLPLEELTWMKLQFRLERSLDPEDDGAWPLWEMAASISPSEVEDDVTIGGVQIAVINLDQHPTPFDYLDEVGTDMCALAGSILKISGRGLRANLQEELDSTGFSSILILHRVELADEWRGTGWLGALLAGVAIQELGRECGMAFTLAAPIDAQHLSDSDFKAVQRKLRKVWARLGFKRDGRNSVLKLNLTQTAFEDGLAALKKHLQ